MARSLLTNPATDLVDDPGSVLFSFVKGEQLEFPVSLNFLLDATSGYSYEAVVIEADNAVDQTSAPLTPKVGGVQTTLNVRVPVNRGNWNSGTGYNKADLVTYNGVVYCLRGGANRVSALTPDTDPYWFVSALNIVYIQFLSSLGSTWSQQPSVSSNTYGFFELRVTEAPDVIFTRTWKPVRGMVEILYSPTDVVPG